MGRVREEERQGQRKGGDSAYVVINIERRSRV